MTQGTTPANEQPYDAAASSQSSSFRQILDALPRGQVLRDLVGRTVRILAVLVFIGGFLGLAWTTIRLYQSTYWPFGQATAVAFIMVGEVIFLAAACRVAYLRGEDILHLNDSQSTMMSICVLLLRLYGEISLILYLVAGILMFFSLWLIDSHPNSLQASFLYDILYSRVSLPLGMRPEMGFIGALAALLSLWIAGVVTLLVCYFLAELISILSNIADNVRRARVAAESHASASRPPD